MFAQGGVCSGGYLPRGCLTRVYLPRCLPGGCLPWGGVHLPLPWTEFLTQACENITFLQLHVMGSRLLLGKACG